MFGFKKEAARIEKLEIDSAVMNCVRREGAIANDRRKTGVIEKWREFDVLYIDPASGNVWMLDTQADAIRAAGITDIPNGYTIPTYEMASCSTSDGIPRISPSVPGQGPR